MKPQPKPEPTHVTRRQFVKGTAIAALSPLIAGCRTTGSSPSEVSSTGGGKQMNSDLLYRSAVDMVHLLQKRMISSEELVRMHLNRIEEVNGKINALVTKNERAIERAVQLDKMRQNGSTMGPLHGLPMTIKDCWDTAGVVSTWGTIGRRNFIPNKDATVVKRLKDAGAILLGKTNTPEFTLSFETWNAIHGSTKNPYELNHSPGGSSGGAASLIASGGIPFDIGTDFGGSIRVPSHCCGITGIKPTSGSVPRTGLCLPPGGIRDFQSHAGPLARYVEDLELILPVIWGPDRTDTWIADVPQRDSSKVDFRGMKCLLMQEYGLPPTEETKAAVRVAANQMAELGVEIIEGKLPYGNSIWEISESLWTHGGFAFAVANRIKAAGTDLKDCSLKFLLKYINEIPSNIPSEKLNLTLDKFQKFRSDMSQEFAKYDLMISPVNVGPAPVTPNPGDGLFPLEHAAYTLLSDLTGWPAGVVRGGTSPDGLPIGVQITANSWREDIVLASMAHLEDKLVGYTPPKI